jgi:hypothetical protein
LKQRKRHLPKGGFAEMKRVVDRLSQKGEASELLVFIKTGKFGKSLGGV